VSDESTLAGQEHAAEEHYSEWQYAKVALILFAITMAEVGIYYVTGARQAVTTLMLIMMVVKFSLVALYFMHLRFDNKLFRRLFVTGIILAIIVYMIALSSLHVFSR